MFNSTQEYTGGKFTGSTKSGPGVNTPQRQNQVERRSARQQDFNNQDIKTAGDFNFNQHNPSNSQGTHVSGQEVRHLRRNHGTQGGSGNVRDTYAELTKQKEAGATFGKRAESQYQNMGDRIEKLDYKKQYTDHFKKIGTSAEDTANLIADYEKNTKGLDPEKAFAALQGGRQFDPQGGDKARYDQASASKAKQRAGNFALASNNVDNTQTQKIKQNNDINTNVTGNNNKTFVNQDNSVRQYGGDNRSFVYNSAGGNSSDSPVSAATMSGFYDVDDSPSAQAGFVDMYKDLNRNNGTRFAGEAMKTMEMFSQDARGYTPEAMENALGKSTQYSFDRADRQTGHVFGDIWNPNYITEDWKMPSAPGKIESNADEIAKKAKDDIDDV
jgi:hypothetical protein